jgi:hypothetical protein
MLRSEKIVRRFLASSPLVRFLLRNAQDGSKADAFGPNPAGILMFDGGGRFSLQEWSTDLSKFASNNRLEGTAEENKAIVQGSVCYFGKYMLDETAKTLTLQLRVVRFLTGPGRIRNDLSP